MEANFKRLYMLKMKARHAKAKTKKERSALIDEAVAMTRYSLKYIIRLLNRSRRHRKHRERKPSYSRDAHRLLIRIWRAEGYMCPLCLKRIIGKEFLNHHLLAFLKTHHPDVRLTRSRPYRKNDNNRIEQKNGSVVHALFGDLRFGDHAQLAPLTALCDQWSLLHNLAIPCRRQVTHHRHVTSRGLTHTRAFDRPLPASTPFDSAESTETRSTTST